MVNFFVYLKLNCFALCFVVAMWDLVHNVDTRHGLSADSM